MYFNKVKTLPWQEKGRWYHAFVESDGSNNTLTSCDIADAALNGNYLQLPANYIVIDSKFAVHTSGGTATSATSITPVIRRFGDGTQAVSVPGATLHDYTEIWFFANYEE